MTIRPHVAGAALMLCMMHLTASHSAHAQPYPTRPVRIVVGFTPSGGIDIAARVIAQKLGESFGQQVIVDNRPGASGIIASELVARSPPDGYMLSMVNRIPNSRIKPLRPSSVKRRARVFGIRANQCRSSNCVVSARPSVPPR